MTLPTLFQCRQAQAQIPEIRVGIRDDSSDVCGDKRSLIIVYVDEISTQDSILGYDLTVRYNPDKLYLTDEIFVNTLTEQFNDHKLTFPEPGIARGWGANILRPVATVQQGQPLVAMRGEFKGICTDTAHIEVSFISFAHVQDDDVLDILGTAERKGIAKAIISDRQDRYITASIDATPIALEGVDTSGFVKVALRNTVSKGVTTATIEVAIDNPAQFKLQDVVGAEGIQLLQVWQSSEGTWRVEVAISPEWVSEELFQFRIASLSNQNDSAAVAVRPVQVNECACVTRLLGSGVELRSSKKISVSVGELEENSNEVARVVFADGSWNIQSDQHIQLVRLSTLLGQNIAIYTDVGKFMTIDNTQLSRGLYLLQIGTGHIVKTIIVEKL